MMPPYVEIDRRVEKPFERAEGLQLGDAERRTPCGAQVVVRLEQEAQHRVVGGHHDDDAEHHRQQRHG